jgi:hypothetical protein
MVLVFQKYRYTLSRHTLKLLVPVWTIGLYGLCGLSSGNSQDKIPTLSITLTKEWCQDLLIDAIPSADVAYKPDQDKDIVPADLNDGGIHIDPPQQVTIPIRIDVTKYLRPPPQQLAAEQAMLAQARAQAMQFTHQISTLNTQIRDNQSRLALLLAKAQHTLSMQNLTPADQQTVVNILQDGVELLQQRLTLLTALPPLLDQVTTTLIQQEPILTTQFSAYQTDPHMLQRLYDFQKDSLTAVVMTQDHLQHSLQQLQATQHDLAMIQTLLNTQQDRLQAADVHTVMTTADALQQHLQETDSFFQQEGLTDSNSTKQTQLAHLSNQLAQLGEVALQKKTILDYAEAGEVKFRIDGQRLYFNNQPLFHEDQAQIMEACRKILMHP